MDAANGFPMKRSLGGGGGRFHLEIIDVAPHNSSGLGQKERKPISRVEEGTLTSETGLWAGIMLLLLLQVSLLLPVLELACEKESLQP